MIETIYLIVAVSMMAFGAIGIVVSLYNDFGSER